MRLVLEGGGARAAYSAGVCQGLEESGARVDVVIGSSSGSLNACFVAAGMTQRIVDHWPIFATDPRVVNFRRQFSRHGERSIGIDTLVDDILFGEGILDAEAATAGNPELLLTATRVADAHGVVARPVASNLAQWLKASLALPVGYNRVVPIDGSGYIDGGVGLPVPFAEPELASHPGPTVVILTRPADRIKPAPSWWQRLLIGTITPKAARSAIASQHHRHNRLMTELGKAEEEGNVVVSNPPPRMPLSRLTRDKVRVSEGIAMGREEGLALAKRLR